MKKKCFVRVKTSFKGIHNFPEASKVFDERVKFLSHPHRHTFYVEVKMQVTHTDRDQEFYILQSEVNQFLRELYECKEKENKPGENYLVLGRKSCEQVAEDLGAKLLEKYPDRELYIEISEDNEASGIIEWTLKEEKQKKLKVVGG